MAQVFISYSRKDISFVRRLNDNLKERGHNVWVDWEGIPPTDKWLSKIHTAIDEADTFLFVISPDSVASEVCETELNHAIKQHKRLVPVVYREVENATVRYELAEINYIFFRESDSFDLACEQLVTALDTDLEWIQAHTRLLIRAVEWEREKRDPSYTLRGNDLHDFEEWLAKSPDKDPKPTSLQSNYLLISRQTVTRRQRIVAIAITIGLSVAVGLGTLAYFQNRESIRQKTIAKARQLINKSQALLDAEANTANKEQSLRAATKSHAIMDGLGIQSVEADKAVRKSMALQARWINYERRPESIDASAFDSTGSYLALFRGRQHLMVWDTIRQKQSESCTLPLAAMQSMSDVAIGDNGKFVVTAVYTATQEDNATEITLWSMPDCNRHLRVKIPGRLQTGSKNNIALSSNGDTLLVSSSMKLHVWNVADKSELSFDFADLVFAFALSPDGRQLATLERNKGERKRRIRIRDLSENRVLREWEHAGRGYWLQWGPKNLVVGNQNTVSIYNYTRGILVYRYQTEDSQFALSPDGRRVAVLTGNYHIQIRDAVSNTVETVNSHDNGVATFAFSPDSKSLITVDEVKRRIRQWSFEKSDVFTILQDKVKIEQIKFSEQGSQLYTKSQQGISAWQLPLQGDQSAPSQQQTSDFVADELFSHYQIQSSDQQGGSRGITTLTVSASDNRLEPVTITLNALALGSSISQNGESLAVILATKITRGGYQRRLEIWNVRTQSRINSRALDRVLGSEMASYLNFAGKDRYLLVGNGTGIEILDVMTLKSTVNLYHGGATKTAIQGNAILAATAGNNGIIRIWDMGSQNEIAQIESAYEVHDMQLSNDGRWLAILDDTGFVRLWLLAPRELIQQACYGLTGTCP